MAVSSTNVRLTYPPPHVAFNPRLSPTSVAYHRLPAADFPLRFKSNFLSAEFSSLQNWTVPVPLVFSDRRCRRTMEPSNVYALGPNRDRRRCRPV
ncbi:unnamed protein product [Microthlaspi erraticum]|uniref:Uncharacterized protein n=1 Tax=Microthlaspi erraticum TaxID=1685480 RepID=A0A6D2HI12_9BRAS|nr:unnamed protein product [Microthlaspi erraticum]